MINRWNDAQAASHKNALALRAYTSRLIGSDSDLVLLGGGNTSVKFTDTVTGAPGVLLWVKGSGTDLAQVTEADFALLRQDCVLHLLDQPGLDNHAMAQGLARCLAHQPAPRPSIETLLHAGLPHTWVEHAHADSVLALCNVRNGPALAHEIFGQRAPYVPYQHSGVELARACLGVLDTQGSEATIGLILGFHGVVAFGNDARTSYENLIRIVNLAEDALRSRGAWDITPPPAATGAAIDRCAVAALRRTVSAAAGFPLIMQTLNDELSLAFARQPELIRIATRGPATPQHAVYTRARPQIGVDVDVYAAMRRRDLAQHLGERVAADMDASPRVILDPRYGACVLGVNAVQAGHAAEIWSHAMRIMWRAHAHGEYCCAPAAEILRAEHEYGGLEQRLRSQAAESLPLMGQVALIAPAAAHDHPGLARQLLDHGAAVVVASADPGTDVCPEHLSVRPDNLSAVLDRLALRFGGLDVLVASTADGAWCDNAGSLLEQSPAGGRIVSPTTLNFSCL